MARGRALELGAPCCRRPVQGDLAVEWFEGGLMAAQVGLREVGYVGNVRPNNRTLKSKRQIWAKGFRHGRELISQPQKGVMRDGNVRLLPALTDTISGILASPAPGLVPWRGIAQPGPEMGVLRCQPGAKKVLIHRATAASRWRFRGQPQSTWSTWDSIATTQCGR